LYLSNDFSSAFHMLRIFAKFGNLNTKKHF
jgi:hypothetical protein